MSIVIDVHESKLVQPKRGHQTVRLRRERLVTARVEVHPADSVKWENTLYYSVAGKRLFIV